MSIFKYKIFQSGASDINKALQELFSQINSVKLTPVRLVIFCNATSNKHYSELRETIEQACKNHYTDEAPLVALIAQAPLDAEFAAEVTFVDGEENTIIRHPDYIILNDEILLTGALYASTSDSIAKQSDDIFSQLGEILDKEEYYINDIVRQWNYIEQITHLSPEGQNYQQFNDARSRFYSKTDWVNGYPAATGIGTSHGGVTIVVDAAKNSSKCSQAIDNPLQVSAHAYSQQVLIDSDNTRHKSTPKFERARILDIGGGSMIYISGTAAIRGEESSPSNDIAEQLRLTMENIAHLYDSSEYRVEMLRIYLKHRSNWPEVKSWIENNCNEIEALCIEADICRQELLIEIEGIANKK
ncbi:MAG: hypothetical protein IKU88_07110 [Alistipes sp.]|nr:hypothetical protein [Alistipes sp.]